MPFMVNAKELDIEWIKSFGGNSNDTFNDTIEHPEEGYIAVGYTNSTDIEGLEKYNNQDAIIIRYDKSGNIMWFKNYNAAQFSRVFYLETLKQIVASTGPKLVFYDNEGNFLKELEYNNLTFLVPTEDEGFVGILKSSDEYTNKREKMKINNKFEIEWNHNSDGDDATFSKIIPFANENYMFVGKSEGDGQYPSVTILDNEGNYVGGWHYYSSDTYIYLNGVIQLTNGNYFASYMKEWDGYYYREYDATGEFIKENKFNLDIYSQSISDITERIEDKVAILVYDFNEEKYTIIEYDSNYNKIWENSIDKKSLDIKNIKSIANDGFILNGRQINSYGESDAILIKYSYKYDLKIPETISNGKAVVEQKGSKGIVTPTPDKGYEVDKVIVKDTSGNEIITLANADGTYSFELYDDVTVEVLFKESIENPKTGILDVITILFIGFIMSLGGFYIVKRYNERLEF